MMVEEQTTRVCERACERCVQSLSPGLAKLVEAAMGWRGIEPERALALAQGADPLDDDERIVASPLRAGWVVAEATEKATGGPR